jgi:hypothetical protein
MVKTLALPDSDSTNRGMIEPICAQRGVAHVALPGALKKKKRSACLAYQLEAKWLAEFRGQFLKILIGTVPSLIRPLLLSGRPIVPLLDRFVRIFGK